MKRLPSLFLVLAFILPLGLMPEQTQGQIEIPKRLKIYPNTEPTLENGFPAYGISVDDKDAEGSPWLFRYFMNEDAKASVIGHYDNGGVPFGRMGETHLRGQQRVVITSESQQRRDQPLYSPIVIGDQIVAIRAAWAAGTGYAANVRDGNVSIIPMTGLDADMESVKFQTDARGAITGFTGLPLKVKGISQTAPPFVLVAPPPIPPGQKKLFLDVSTICFARESPDGYYPENGSKILGLRFSGMTDDPKLRSYYAGMDVNVVDSRATHPRGELYISTANDFADSTGGHQYRLVIGQGTFAYGQQDPGAGNAAFEVAKISRLEFKVLEWNKTVPDARTIGPSIAFVLERGRVRPIYSDTKTWWGLGW